MPNTKKRPSKLSFIFDTETTGLPLPEGADLKAQPYIIEFYGVLYDHTTKRNLKAYHTFIKPPIAIPPIITRITGLSDKDVATAPNFKKAFSMMIKGAVEKADILVAHNLTFDMTMLKNDMARTGQTLTWPKRRLCTVEATEFIHGYRIGLGNLHEYLFGDVPPKAHRAQEDVVTLLRCYLELIKKGVIEI